MVQQLIIPWRNSNCSFREKHFNYLYNFYSKYFDVIVADNEGKFSVAASRNLGVKNSNSEISIIVDADNYIDIEQILDAVYLAKNNDNIVKPFEFFVYLDELQTKMFYSDKSVIKRKKFFDQKCEKFPGGAYVVKKQLWIDIGGMDEGFVGWGGEDDAFFETCYENLQTEPLFVHGYNYHLYHPAIRTMSSKNRDYYIKKYTQKNLQKQ